jgi:hypothetical protein
MIIILSLIHILACYLSLTSPLISDGGSFLLLVMLGALYFRLEGTLDQRVGVLAPWIAMLSFPEEWILEQLRVPEAGEQHERARDEEAAVQ